MIADFVDARADEQRAPSLLAQIAAELSGKPFVPHPLITKGFSDVGNVLACDGTHLSIHQ